MADSKKYNGSTWEHSLHELTTATEAVENPLYSDGTAITAYTIKGNTVQNGTPTPDNPVEVNGVGERTENLFNLNAVDTAKGYMENYRLNSGNPDVAVGNFITEYIAVIPDSTYTISGFTAGWSSSVVWYDSTFAKIGYQLYENKSINTFTVPSNAKYVRFTGDIGNKDFMMFNLGSTAKPYEPYGYKIPISNGQQTTNIYLGSTQTVRQIKKYVCTGTETVRAYDTTYSRIFVEVSSLPSIGIRATPMICSHFQGIYDGRHITLVPLNSVYSGSPSIDNGFYIKETDYQSDTSLKAFLADQYASGTPVTVWYALATPETAALNEPLMKIGTYADTLSNAASIPTTEGANTISVDTTVQPSEFTATWTGWHDASVKEWDGSQWG